MMSVAHAIGQSGAEFPGFGLLLARDCERTLEICFPFSAVVAAVKRTPLTTAYMVEPPTALSSGTPGVSLNVIAGSSTPGRSLPNSGQWRDVHISEAKFIFDVHDHDTF